MLAWCKNPQDAAAYVLKSFNAISGDTISLADDLCENTFLFREHWEMERTNKPVTFKDKIDWEHVPQGDPEWAYALNRHTCFVILAKAYLYTENKKYAEAFERIAEDWLQNAPLTDKAKNTSWRSIEAGLRVESWLFSMPIFKSTGLLSTTLFERMNESLQIHAEYLKNTHADFHVLSNWGVLQDHGLFLLGLYFNDKSLCDLSTKRLTENLNIQVMRDGSHWEQSPMYHCEVLHCFMDTVFVGRQNGYQFTAEFENGIHNMCRALSVWIKPCGKMPMQGDSDDINARDLIATGAFLFNDSLLKYYANGEIFEENIWQHGVEFVEKYNALGRAIPENSSVALCDSGNYFMRSDNTPNAVWLSFHCGCLGSGHGHADQLHINLSAYGEDILIDTGRYTYVDSPMRRTLKGASAHNTTRVDGKEFSEQLDSWGYKTLANPLKGEYTFLDEIDYVKGAHMGYLNNNVLTTRRVLFIKPDIFIVLDTFFTKEKHEYEQFYNFAKGKVSLSGNTACFDGESASAKLISLGNVHTKIEKHPVSYEYNLLSECDALVVKAEAEGAFTFVSVISTLRAGEKHELSAELMPVYARRKGIELDSSKAQGIKIIKNGKQTVVLACHQELISEVELLQTSDCLGYGKMIVFDDTLPKTGFVLEW